MNTEEALKRIGRKLDLLLEQKARKKPALMPKQNIPRMWRTPAFSAHAEKDGATRFTAHIDCKKPLTPAEALMLHDWLAVFCRSSGLNLDG